MDSRYRWLAALVLVGAALTVAAGSGAIASSFGLDRVAQEAYEHGPIPVGISPAEERNIRVFRQASPSTVFISKVSVRRTFFSLQANQYVEGTGSGFVWDTRGNIVTNFHVVQGTRNTTYVVKLWDQSEWEAELVGLAPEKDLAVLRIQAPLELLHPVTLGTSEMLAVGQAVLALGNPFGLDQTLTVGIVSAIGRDLQAPNGRTIRDVIQTDAAINPGNSGGPLLDSSGRLIGVNTAIASPSGASAGVGFAIPVDTVRRLVPQLIEYGMPVQTGIGITVLPDYQARRYGLEGIVVLEVASGLPAERAGLHPARSTERGWVVEDRIVSVNGRRVRTLVELQDAFEEAGGAGRRVTLGIVNGGQSRLVDVDLVEIR